MLDSPPQNCIFVLDPNGLFHLRIEYVTATLRELTEPKVTTKLHLKLDSNHVKNCTNQDIISMVSCYPKEYINIRLNLHYVNKILNANFVTVEAAILNLIHEINWDVNFLCNFTKTLPLSNMIVTNYDLSEFQLKKCKVENSVVPNTIFDGISRDRYSKYKIDSMSLEDGKLCRPITTMPLTCNKIFTKDYKYFIKDDIRCLQVCLSTRIVFPYALLKI